MKEQEIRKILDDPVTCEDGRSHYIDENNKRYLVGEILQIFAPKGEKPPILDPEEIRSAEANAALANIGLKSKVEVRLIKKQAIAEAQRDADIVWHEALTKLLLDRFPIMLGGILKQI